MRAAWSARASSRKKLEVPLAIVDKRRTDINVTEVMNVIGDVRGRTCLILDDIVDTAGTLVKTVDALLDQGARQGLRLRLARRALRPGCRAHRQLAHRGAGRHQHHPAARRRAKLPKIKVLSIAGLLGRAIESIHMETSVSTLFN